MNLGKRGEKRGGSHLLLLVGFMLTLIPLSAAVILQQPTLPSQDDSVLIALPPSAVPSGTEVLPAEEIVQYIQHDLEVRQRTPTSTLYIPPPSKVLRERIFPVLDARTQEHVSPAQLQQLKREERQQLLEAVQKRQKKESLMTLVRTISDQEEKQATLTPLVKRDVHRGEVPFIAFLIKTATTFGILDKPHALPTLLSIIPNPIDFNTCEKIKVPSPPPLPSGSAPQQQSRLSPSFGGRQGSAAPTPPSAIPPPTCLISFSVKNTYPSIFQTEDKERFSYLILNFQDPGDGSWSNDGYVYNINYLNPTLFTFSLPSSPSSTVKVRVANYDYGDVYISNAIIVPIIESYKQYAPLISSVIPNPFVFSSERQNPDGTYTLTIKGKNFFPSYIDPSIPSTTLFAKVITPGEDNKPFVYPFTYLDSETLAITTDVLNDPETVVSITLYNFYTGVLLSSQSYDILFINDGTGTSGEPGSTVALLEVELPEDEQFILHGVIPVPKGTYFPGSGTNPLSILDKDGTLAHTQVEAGSLYPNDKNDGADTVEVLARVKRDPTLTPGQRDRYQVTLTPTEKEQADSLDPADFLSLDSLDPALSDLLQRGIKIATKDVYNNRYECDILNVPADNVRVFRDGGVARSIRTFCSLTPVGKKACNDPSQQCPYPHLFTVHSYLTTFAGENSLLVDFSFKNTQDGLSASTNQENKALQDIYFTDISLTLPPENMGTDDQWIILPEFDAPHVSKNPYSGTNVWGIVTTQGVNSQGGYTLTYMRKQDQMNRRFVITQRKNTNHAQNLRWLSGLGFVPPDREFDGVPLWSWWNPATARYGSNKAILPRTEHPQLNDPWKPPVNQNTILAWDKASLAKLRNILKTGSAGFDEFLFAQAVIGNRHVYGVPYGGMTGGGEIWEDPYAQNIFAGSKDAVLIARGVGQMYMDRTRNGLHDLHGNPTRYTTLIKNDIDGTPYIQAGLNTISLVADIGGSGDVFGFVNAPTFHTNDVIAQDKMPSWKGALDGIDVIDMQHLVRSVKELEFSAFISNDALAKEQFETLGNLIRISFRPEPKWNSYTQQYNPVGMLLARQHVDRYPHRGLVVGRDTGWMMDYSATAYTLSDVAYRSGLQPWFGEFADIMEKGQVACTGFTHTMVNYDKFWGDAYADVGNIQGRQVFEQFILEGALRAMRESVFRGVDSPHLTAVNNVLWGSYVGHITTNIWNPAKNEPWYKVAVGPEDWSLPAFCPDDLIPLYHLDGAGNFQAGSTFADTIRLARERGDTAKEQDFLSKLTAMASYKGNLEIGLYKIMKDSSWAYGDNTVNYRDALTLAQEGV